MANAAPPPARSVTPEPRRSSTNAALRERAFELASYVLAVILAAGALHLIEHDKSQSILAAQRTFVQNSQNEASAVRGSVERMFRQIYQGLRTIARLPAVNDLNVASRTLDPTARRSIQEIYNNLAENVSISEVYIIPADFDPDAPPGDHAARVPIATFDELIVGRTADTGPRRLREPQEATAISTGLVEEIEIYEYRLMRRQIGLLRSRYPSQSRIDQLAYPAILGEEVITCDNTHFSPSRPNDSDRTGLVYSVPFYDADGRLSGIVSAVILTRAIRRQLPSANFELHGSTYELSIRGEPQTPAAAPAAQGVVPRALGYYDVAGLDIHDLVGQWQLVTSIDDAAFLATAPVVSARDKARYETVILGLLLTGALGAINTAARRHRSIEQRNEELDRRVRRQTAEIARAREAAEVANEAKSRFLADISHEIRTPVSIVVGAADLLSARAGDASSVEKIGLIRRAAGMLHELVSQVLDLSALEKGRVHVEPAPIRLHDLAAEARQLCEGMAAGKPIEVSVTVDARLPEHVMLDAAKVRQVLTNLASNAVKFTPKGSIVLSAEPGEHLADGHKSIRFSVADTGTGIDPGVGDRIFDPFHRARESIESHIDGTGLGLAICSNLVTLMGGMIGYRSTPGRGTTFAFELPLWSAVPLRETPPERPGPDTGARPAAPLDGIRILVAEDNSALRGLIEEMLVAAGAQPVAVGDGEAAVAEACARAFDVILMDCRMPGMDGLTASRHIRDRERSGRHPAVPIIALTANAFMTDRRDCIEAGMTGFLAKPFTAAAVTATVITALQPARMPST